VAAVVVLAMALPAVWAVARAGEARSLVSDVFTSSSSDPVFEPAAPAADAATTPADRAGVTNVLLLGGDAGPGRWGLRTDTMILVSADRASGRTSLISIPRNLQRLRFPPGSPLAERFPDGFDDLANAVYPYVSTKQDLLDAYGGDGVQPEARAVAEAVGYSLGVRIDDYVLVNMQGFLELVDAVGGVTVELDSSVPLPPNLPGAKREIPSSIGPGVVELDGTLALAFARSRSADSDYQRMDRQRQLLSAVGSQVSVGDAVSGFSSVASALSDTVRTSLSTSDFADLVDTLGDDGAVFESVGLVPPIVEPGRPDYDTIRGIVDDVQRSIVTGEPSGWDAPDA
jgi:LCP family protein required for cell wall assembly